MLFVFIRLTSFFSSINVIFPGGTPNLFKVGFSLFISAIIAFGINIDVNITTNFDLINYVIMEVITGMTLGYITSICFNTLRIGGSLIDQQLGMSMANIYDPNNKEQTTLIENLMFWMGIMIFLGMNGHHRLIEGIQQSFVLIPIGESILENRVGYIVNIFIECFIIGYKIAIPIVLSLIITDIIMGLISRSVPQLNVMIVGMPIKILVGIMFLIVALPIIGTRIYNLLNQIPSILDGTFGFYEMAPIGMALSQDGDKTEEPTAKKKRDARKKGNVAKSKEVVTAITLIGVLLIAYTMSDYIILELKNFLVTFLSSDFKVIFDNNTIRITSFALLISFMKIFLPIALIIITLSLVGNLIQTGFLLTGEGLKPQLSKINPINGFKNKFSLKALGTLVKSIAIIVVLFYIGYSFMRSNIEGMLKIGDIYFPYLIYNIIDIIKRLLLSICIAVVIIAVLDFAYERYTHKRGLKMTKQEVKEEFKQMEGDPHIKGKIKQKQREMSSARMMAQVPSATAIITNPTHISIAIKYEKGKDTAPIVVAKGADIVALKIREIAKENDIPIIENKPLARFIYKEVDIEQEIPEEMYQAVAEVLVSVYKIKNRYKKL